MFTRWTSFFKLVFTKKTVFQPGFNRPKQYKREMRRMRHIYISIPLSMLHTRLDLLDRGLDLLNWRLDHLTWGLDLVDRGSQARRLQTWRKSIDIFIHNFVGARPHERDWQQNIARLCVDYRKKIYGFIRARIFRSRTLHCGTVHRMKKC